MISVYSGCASSEVEILRNRLNNRNREWISDSINSWTKSAVQSLKFKIVPPRLWCHEEDHGFVILSCIVFWSWLNCIEWSNCTLTEIFIVERNIFHDRRHLSICQVAYIYLEFHSQNDFVEKSFLQFIIFGSGWV